MDCHLLTIAHVLNLHYQNNTFWRDDCYDKNISGCFNYILFGVSSSGLRDHSNAGSRTEGYHAYIAFDHSMNTGTVLLANTATTMVTDLGRGMMRVLQDKPHSFELPEQVTVSEEVLSHYVGKYKLAPGAIFTITLDEGQLFAQLTGQQTLQIHPESDTEFHYRVVPARIVFELDDDGEVKGLVLHQGGREMPARRLPDDVL